jgi:predicted ATPase
MESKKKYDPNLVHHREVIECVEQVYMDHGQPGTDDYATLPHLNRKMVSDVRRMWAERTGYHQDLFPTTPKSITHLWLNRRKRGKDNPYVLAAT